jgi:calcium-dependent protein kinase
MGAVISSLCADQEQETQKKKGEDSLLRRQVRAEVIVPTKHLRKDDTALGTEKSALGAATVKQQYNFMEELGKGSYGSVQRAVLKTSGENGRSFAVKTIEKARYPKEVRRFLREIELLKSLDHPYIVRFYEAYESKTAYFIVQELCSGGDLGKVLDLQTGGFKESDTKEFMWQILMAVNYLNLKGIAHRDIKPENFLLSSQQASTLKLIDFGLSATGNSAASTLRETVGSPFYIAPEVIDQEYGPSCDVWSCGVVLYNLVTGRFPFEAEQNNQVFELIKRGVYDKSVVEASGYSAAGKDLLYKMLLKVEEGRPTAKVALQHPWFADKREEIVQRGKKVVTRGMLEQIKNFGFNSIAQREIIGLLMLQQDFSSPEVSRLVDAFMYIDKDLSGTLSAEEIEEIYSSMGMPITREEVEEIIDSLYFREKSVVTYLEFIAATLDREFYKNKQRIRELFNYMDVDMSGEIDYKDIQDCFKRFGRLLDETKIRRMIAECDHNKDQKISFEEFYLIVNAEPKRQNLSLSKLSQLSTGQLKTT